MKLLLVYRFDFIIREFVSMISYKRLENPQLLSGNGQVKIIFGLIKSNILTNVYQYYL